MIYMMDASLKQISSYKAIKYNIVSCLMNPYAPTCEIFMRRT